MGRLPSKPAGSVRLVASADLHLGRQIPLPEPLKNPLFSPGGVWQQLVDLVLDEEIEADALLLAGDIFDNEADLLESPYLFEKGLRRLSKGEKPVIAIAGNHDFRALKRRHRLAALPNFHLLGKEGKWEALSLHLAGQQIRFEGWSFPTTSYRDNPLAALPPREEGIVSIGLLHGECDGNKESDYAPFSLKELVNSRRDVWVLGHVHIPKQLSANPPIFYCGSLQGLDPSESDERGVWVIDIDRSGKIVTHFLPFACIVWQELSLVYEGQSMEDLEILMQREVERVLHPWPQLRAAILRVHFTGETYRFKEAAKLLQECEGLFFTLQKGGVPIDCYVQSCESSLKPSINLQLLAAENSLVGMLARKLLVLKQADHPDRKALLQEGRHAFEEMGRSYIHFQEEIDEENLSEILIAKGYEILNELTSQRGLG